MPYFRASGEPNDRQLLPVSLRDDEQLVALAARAEAEVIGAYTVSTFGRARYRDALEEAAFNQAFDVAELAGATRLADHLYVCLRGYTEDPALCEDSRLVAALRLEIADVIRWKWKQWEKDPSLASDSKNGSGVSYRHDAEHRLPPDFGAYLRPWDVRPVYDGL